jgi:hypothetical protein
METVTAAARAPGAFLPGNLKALRTGNNAGPGSVSEAAAQQIEGWADALALALAHGKPDDTVSRRVTAIGGWVLAVALAAACLRMGSPARAPRRPH